MDDFSELWMCNYVDNVTINNGIKKSICDISRITTGILSLTETQPNLQDIWNCNWNYFMALPLTNKLILNLSNEDELDNLEANVNELLPIAISSLQLFVQQNFIGPYSEFVPNDVPLSNEIRLRLQINGIDLNVNVENPELFLLSMKIIKYLMKLSPTSYILQWWYLRILYIYNEILDEPSESLYTDFGIYSEELLKRLDDLSSCETKALLVLEIIQQYLSYKRVNKAQQHLEMVRNLLETNFEVKGV